MNKKIYIKIGIALAFILYICTGCSLRQERKYSIEDLDNLAEIRIYSAESNELINTISDEEQLYRYNQCSFSDDPDIIECQGKLKKDLEGVKEQYYLVAYKYPVARFGKKELEKNMTVTLYEDTNIIKMTAAEESVKGFSIPEEFLTFYYKMSGEDMEFYRSLTE